MKKQVKAELVPMSIPEGGSRGEFLCIMKGTSSLLLIDYDCCLPKAEYWDPMQLIITDESEVKKGSKVNVDKCIGTVISITGTFCTVDFGWSTTQLKPISDCKVIISAYPLIEGVCPVSVQFLNNYADANGKGEVWVAYGGEFMLSVKNSTFAKYSTFVGNPNYGKVVLDPNGCAVLELREEEAASVLGENGKRIVAHLKERKESLQKIVDAEAGRDDDAAVAAYHVSMDYLIEGKLTVARSEDYRWGFYEGTQWQKNRPVAGNQREAVYTKEDMKLMWEAGVDFGAEVDGGYDGVKFDVTLDRITKSKAAL